MKINFLWKFSISFILVFIVMVPVMIEASILGPGTPAPTFSMPSLSGKRESLRVWCGKKLIKPYVNDISHTVIISFWATYCKPCHKEIPELHEFYKKHKDEHLRIFLISIDDKGAGVVVPFAKEHNYTLPILFDPYKKTAERYGVKSLPALFVVDPNGTIQYSSIGYKEDVPLLETLETVFSAIKEGKAVTVQEDDEKGESVAVQDEEVKDEPKQFSSKQKWHAVARVECGEAPDVIANELGVEKSELKKWYADLKGAAIELWESKQAEKKLNGDTE